MKWQPIETAPKDGTVIKLLIPYNREIFTEAECMDVGYWLSIDQIIGSEALSKSEIEKGGCFIFNGCDGAFDMQPTHWMPLREPPE